MKLIFDRVRETKNWSVYQLRNAETGIMPKSQLYFTKDMSRTLVFELTEET